MLFRSLSKIPSYLLRLDARSYSGDAIHPFSSAYPSQVAGAADPPDYPFPWYTGQLWLGRCPGGILTRCLNHLNLATFHTKEHWVIWINFSTYPSSQENPFQPLVFGTMFCWSSLMTMGEGRNENWPVFLAFLTLLLLAQLYFQRNSDCNTTPAAPVLWPISCSNVFACLRTPSIGAETQSLPRAESFSFLPRTMALDLEVLLLMPAASQSAVNWPSEC